MVCKADSESRINQIANATVRNRNLRLLEQCEYRDLQAAVDAVTDAAAPTSTCSRASTGRSPSWDPPCTDGLRRRDRRLRPLIVSCGEVINLVTDRRRQHRRTTTDIECNAVCDLQIEGTGEKANDVLITGGFTRRTASG